MTTGGGGGAGCGAGGGGGGSKNTHLVSMLVRVVCLTIVFLGAMFSHSIYFYKKYFNFLSLVSDKKKIKN
jgi:hypothetical protein